MQSETGGISSKERLAKRLAIVAFVVFLAGFAFYLGWQPKLIQYGIQNQVYYFLLIVGAVACAALLFGVLESSAHLTQERFGVKVVLSGPIVLLVLMVYGGFKLAGRGPQAFDIAVRAHSGDTPSFTHGRVTLDLPGRPSKEIGPDGEANFKGLAPQSRESSINVLVQVDGYKEEWQYEELEGNTLEVELHRERPITDLSGTIEPLPQSLQGIKILVDGQDGQASPDQYGRFKLSVAGKPGDRVRLRVFEGSKQVYDNYQVLGGPVTLSVH